MRRQINLLNEQYEVTVLHQSGSHTMRVGDGPAQKIKLIGNGDQGKVIPQVGDRREAAEMVIQGETIFIRAFSRNFMLQIVDPIEQATGKAGTSRESARAPMPGVVVEVLVEDGDAVTQGQPLMTIESMKILTVIKAPRSGVVKKVHLKAGETFEKNTVLVSLTEEEEK